MTEPANDAPVKRHDTITLDSGDDESDLEIVEAARPAKDNGKASPRSNGKMKEDSEEPLDEPEVGHAVRHFPFLPPCARVELTSPRPSRTMKQLSELASEGTCGWS